MSPPEGRPPLTATEQDHRRAVAARDAYVLVPLYNRQDAIVGWAKVDGIDADRVKARRWRRTHFGYAITGGARADNSILLHRFILGLAAGDRRQGDHRNGDRLDCRRANLRIVTNSQNAQNMAARAGTSRHRGVSYRKDTDKWTGYVKVNGHRHCAGCFDSEDAAAAAVIALRAELMPFDEPSRHALDKVAA